MVAISAGPLDPSSPGDEVVTINHDGQLEVWDTARRAKNPVVLYRVGDDAIQHVDVFVADVGADSPGDEIVATTSIGNVIIYAAAGRTLRTLQLSEPALRVDAGNLTDETGREIVVVSRATGNLFIVDAAGHPLGVIRAERDKPFVDVTVIGEVRQRAPDSERFAFRYRPVCEIRRGADGDFAWQVPELNFENGGEGLISAYNCLFTIPNYWPYAVVSSQSRCLLPGKLFIARASGHPSLPSTTARIASRWASSRGIGQAFSQVVRRAFSCSTAAPGAA